MLYYSYIFFIMVITMDSLFRPDPPKFFPVSIPQDQLLRPQKQLFNFVIDRVSFASASSGAKFSLCRPAKQKAAPQDGGAAFCNRRFL